MYKKETKIMGENVLSFPSLSIYFVHFSCILHENRKSSSYLQYMFKSYMSLNCFQNAHDRHVTAAVTVGNTLTRIGPQTRACVFELF